MRTMRGAVALGMGLALAVGGSGLADHGDPTTTEITYLADRTGDPSRIQANAHVEPEHPNVKAKFILLKKKSGSWMKARKKSRRAELAEGSYLYYVSFPKPDARRCKLRVKFPGDADHDGSKDARRFNCKSP